MDTLNDLLQRATDCDVRLHDLHDNCQNVRRAHIAAATKTAARNASKHAAQVTADACTTLATDAARDAVVLALSVVIHLEELSSFVLVLLAALAFITVAHVIERRLGGE